MKKLTSELRYPKKSMVKLGTRNPNFKHGGYCLEPLNESELRWIEQQKKRYMDAYPHLQEPAMEDLLDELLLTRCRMLRVTRFIDDPTTDPEDRLSAAKYLDTLQHTWMLIMQRMGLTVQSRPPPKKEKKKGLTKEDIIRKFSEEDKP